MIPLDKLKSITHVITHANCPDGIASALIIKDALPDVRVSFMYHGDKAHRELQPEPGLLFADFTPIRERVAEFVAAGSLVLDHHPTAKDIVEAFGENGVFGLNEKNECGAWLAYEHVWKPLCELRDELVSENEHYNAQTSDEVRDFAELAAIRDTWKQDSPRWDAACRQAATLVFWGYEKLSLTTDDWAVPDERLGRHLLDKQLSAAQRSLGEAHHFRTTKGTHVCMFQGVSTTSDAAELEEKTALGKREQREALRRSGFGVPEPFDSMISQIEESLQADLIVGFHYRAEACGACGGGGDNDPSGEHGDDPLCLKCRGAGSRLQLQFSTRSHTGYDVGAFCKSFPGGGGHKAAAGFTVEVSPEVSTNPYAMFRLLLEEWETGQ